MAWRAYYVNIGKLYDTNGCEEDICVFYDLKIPPHGGIRREWTTRGMKHGESKIYFVEYWLEDDDPDGVWEAYGMKRDSEYSFTVRTEEADPAKLFVYTLYKNGSLLEGVSVDTGNARAILVFAQPQSITAEQLASVAEKIKNAPRTADMAERIILEDLLDGNTDVMCLAFINW